MDRATRFIIWNQLEIQKNLGHGNKQDIENNQAILEGGYTKLYDSVLRPIGENEASEDMQDEVFEILDMFRALDNARSHGWTPSNPANSSNSKFRGFDANNDDHYHFAALLLDQMGLYSESAPNKNSHTSSELTKYRRMVAEWGRTGKPHPLSHSQADAIIAA